MGDFGKLGFGTRGFRVFWRDCVGVVANPNSKLNKARLWAVPTPRTVDGGGEQRTLHC